MAKPCLNICFSLFYLFRFFIVCLCYSKTLFSLFRINDRIVSANGFNLDNADYATAVQIMKDSEHLNLVNNAKNGNCNDANNKQFSNVFL